ncbi:MAG TPA: hypothetical protein VF727_13490 [Allosphingosinicella sp.]|jgi:hypothetical protein
MAFQGEIAAWIASHMLADLPVGSRFGLDPAETAVQLRCETGIGLDDIEVTLSGGGTLKVQCKTRLAISDKPESPFGKLVAQLVAELARDPLLRPESSALAIVVAAPGSRQLDAFEAACRRVEAGGVEELQNASAVEQAIFAKFSSLAHQAAEGGETEALDIRQLASLVRVRAFEFGTTGSTRRTAIHVLEREILDAPEGEKVFDALLSIISDIISTGIPTTRTELLIKFRRKGFGNSRARALPSLAPRLGAELVLTPRSTADVPTRRSSVGEIVQWGHLIDGHYCERPAVLMEALSNYREWKAGASQTTNSRKLPCFWIDGRSGDGKSVLLLQMCEAILLSEDGTIIVQTVLPDALPDVIQVIEMEGSPSTQYLVLVEDIHTTGDQKSVSSALKLQTDSLSMNIGILCCGPTPEMQAFVSANRSISIRQWTMPPLSADDTRRLGEWFAADVTTPGSDGRDLLVETLFIARVGQPLNTFATSFASRLRTFDVFDLVQNIVAINALDLRAPMELLESRDQRDSIERLARGDQLHFEITEEAWGRGVRLIHGAIAWRLFSSWSEDPLRDPPIERRFARALAAAISALPEHYRFIASLTRQTGRRLHSLETSASARMDVREFWSALLDAVRAEKHAYATIIATMLAGSDTWNSALDPTKLLCLAADIFGDTEVPTAPRAYLGAWLSAKSSHSPEVSIQYREQSETLCLKDSAHPIAEDVVRKLVSCGSNAEFVDSWLTARGAVDISPHVLCVLLGKFGPRPTIISATNKWVRTNWERRVPPQPLCVAMRYTDSDKTKRLAKEWLSSRPIRAENSDLICAWLGRSPRDPDARKAAEEWLLAEYRSDRAVDVLSVLLNSLFPSELERLRSTVQRILEAHSNSPRTGDVIPKLLKTYRKEEYFLDYARRWVQANLSGNASRNVIGGLASSDWQSDISRKTVFAWIETHADSHIVPEVISSLLKVGSEDPETVGFVIQYCSDHIGNASLFNTLGTLIRLGICREDSLILSAVWIVAHFDHPGSANLLSSLLNSFAEERDIVALALEWMRGHLGYLQGGHLLSTLWRCAPTDDLDDISFEWYRLHYEEVQAAEVIAAALSRSELDAVWDKVATDWLRDNTHRPVQQQEVLAAAVASAPDRWCAQALELLKSVRRPSSSLIHALLTAGVQSEELGCAIERLLVNSDSYVQVREEVLVSWLASGDVAAVNFALKVDGRDGRQIDGNQLFGIATRACARSWQSLMAVATETPRLRRDIAWRIGQGLKSVTVDFVSIAGSLRDWPSDCRGELVAGLLKSDCDTADLLTPLLEWLSERRRPWGYRAVLSGLHARMKKEGTFASRLPRYVYEDVRALGEAPR